MALASVPAASEAGAVTDRHAAPVAAFDSSVRAAGPTMATGRVARFARLGVAGADTVTVAGSMVLAYAVSRAFASDPESLSTATYERVGIVALPLWLIVFHRYRLYNARHVATRRDELGRLTHAVGVSALLTAVVAYGLNQIVARSWLILVFVLAMAATAIEREVLRRVFWSLRRKGYLLRPVAIAGTGEEALAMVTTMATEPELGYRVVALVGDPSSVMGQLADHGPVIQPGPRVAEELRRLGVRGVIVPTTDVDVRTSNRLIRTLTDAGIHVELSSSLADIDSSRLSVHPLGRFPMLYVEPVARTGWRPRAKRAFDVAGSALLLLMCLPVLAVSALAVKATSPGPVLYRQERVGRGGRRFLILKFRSMYVDAERRLAEAGVMIDGPVPKLDHDPRVTRAGQVLRALSVDELPQLVNVFRGDMSLVGPRPEQPSEVSLWAPDLFDRLRVRPGLTGIWQVSGRSEARDTKDRWDLYYVDNWSMWRDLAILGRTLPVVISRRGAY